MGGALATPLVGRFERIGGRDARARIAEAVLHVPDIAGTLGEIVLAPHQRRGASRLARIINQHGGALLADDVGMGKTYTALAVARGSSGLVVVAPAALREMWRRAVARSAIPARIVSFEWLSRSPPELPEASFVIVDEAHHARNRATRRYAALARLTRGARVLLLSATPIHNSPRDLRALLGLFLGSAADHARNAELARFLVRRRASDVPSGMAFPALLPVEWTDVPHDDATMAKLLAIPAPVPARDGRPAHALLALALLRLWSSSDGALCSALRRMLGRAAALTAALQDGRHPTRRELTAWHVDSAGVQLAFPAIVASAGGGVSPATLLATLGNHVTAVRHALEHIERTTSGDAARAAWLANLLERDPAVKVVAFSQFAETARAMFDRLRGVAGVAMLTAQSARTAGGRVSREDVLTAFAARGAHRSRVSRSVERREATHHAAPFPDLGSALRTTTSRDTPDVDLRRSFDIRLLITTDLLSEGVDLQRASTIVHLDLPWTPARIYQRTGRLRRPGSARPAVTSFAFSPPAAAEAWAGVIRRLQRKARGVARVVGSAELLEGTPWEAGALAEQRGSLAEGMERLYRAMRSWRGAAAAAPTASPDSSSGDRQPQLAVVRGDRRKGWSALVLLERARDLELHLLDPCGSTKSGRAIARALSRFDGADRPTDDCERDALTPIERWLARQAGRDAVREADDASSPGHAKVLRALHAAFHALPRRAKARLSSGVAEARAIISQVHGAAIERELELVAASIREAPAGDADELETILHSLMRLRATTARGEVSREGHLRVAIVIVSLPPRIAAVEQPESEPGAARENGRNAGELSR